MRKDDIVERLREVQLFAECSKTDLRSVLRHSERLEIEAGRDIVVEGNEGKVFYLVLTGEVEVRRKGRKVAALGPGAHFGELALLDPGPRNATIRATTDVEVLGITERMFQVVMRDLPTLRRGMLRGLAGRIRELDKRA